jgi:hypothetical protein
VTQKRFKRNPRRLRVVMQEKKVKTHKAIIPGFKAEGMGDRESGYL